MQNKSRCIVLLVLLLITGVTVKKCRAVDAAGTLKGLNGVSVNVLTNAEVEDFISTQKARDAVEKQLRDAGVPVFSSEQARLQPGKPVLNVWITLTPKPEPVANRAYVVMLDLTQESSLNRDLKIVTPATTWSNYSVGSADEDSIASSMSEQLSVVTSNFIKDYFFIPLSDSNTVGKATFPLGSTAQGGQGQTVAGVPCAVGMAETYHIHAHVSLFVNGEQVAIPAGIGITNPVEKDGKVNEGKCMYALHTHGPAGIVHIETEKPTDYTLGQFFDIWGRPLSRTNVAGFAGPVTVHVNGERYYGDPRAILFASHQEITLQVGTRIAKLPAYTFPSDLKQ